MGSLLSKINECLCKSKDIVEDIKEVIEDNHVIETVKELNEIIKGDSP